MTRRRVVIAGLGDSGVLTAIRLAGTADVVGISAQPALVSGQELGMRLTRPQEWARDYLVPFDRYRALDGVRTVQAKAVKDSEAAAARVLGDAQKAATAATSQLEAAKARVAQLEAYVYVIALCCWRFLVGSL